MRRLVSQKPRSSTVNIAVLGCSKGAEVYSIVWTLRSACPDLKLSLRAVDVSEEILEFAARGIYSRTDVDAALAENRDLAWNTHRDQNASMFTRMTDEEMAAMFEVRGSQAEVRSWLKEGIVWVCEDAGDPNIVERLGQQDIVVANRFLCHMTPAAAENCLLNIARLVKPGGHLFVSGIDLDVRTKVVRRMGWKPVTALIREIHHGDPSLTAGWPFNYWALEPFYDHRLDWRIRYASVFQIVDNRKSGRTFTPGCTLIYSR